MAGGLPSENEWMVMEVFWASTVPLTASEVISRLRGVKDVSQKTIRVMINRLLQKKIIDYNIDKKDSRVYHYFPIKSKEACLQEKSAWFVNSYFGGKTNTAVAAFLKSGQLTDTEIMELDEILRKQKQEGD